MPVPFTENQVLAQLRPDTLAAFEPVLREERLTRWQLLRDVHEPVTRIYFPIDSIISVVSLMENGAIAESYATGRDGFAGIEAVWGTEARPLFRMMCQIPGTCYSLETGAFLELAAGRADVSEAVGRYAYCLLALTGRSGACNLLHPVVERCAKWLLLSHDRVGRPTLDLTQEILSTMLGVQRPSVTIAAGTLQKAGLIRYSRGRITITDRARLEEASCECYRVVADEFCRVLGGPKPQSA